MKNYFFTLLLSLLFYNVGTAQVGIANTNPKATLDITASNVATPSNTDGILIPRVDAFPIVNPTAAQNGMLVFLTTTKAFYFWNWNTVTSTGVWVPIGPDHDFYKVGTTLPPTTINDDFFTNGKIGINKAIPTSSIDIVDLRGNTAFNLAISDSPGIPTNTDTYSIKTVMNNTNNSLSIGSSIGLSNSIVAINEAIGVENIITGNIVSVGSIYGTKQSITNSGSGEVYGIYNVLSGNSTGNMFGSYNKLTGSSTGTHYGVFSESLSGFAGYFLGKVAIGTTSANTYSLPSSRGTNGQIMQTDGNGNLSWANTSLNTSWKLTGNIGTNTTTNFIGTIDNVNLAFRAGNSQKMILNTSGNLGINVANPQDKIHVNGGIRMDHYSSGNFWAVGVDIADDYNFYYNNTLRSYIQDTDGSYNIVSDRRLKNNIQVMDSSVVQKVMQLNPVTYSYKSDSTNKKQDGFIAQEVQKLFPELVSEKKTENGEFLTLRYDAFGVLAIKTIQEQQKEIENLKKQVSELKKLEARILLLEKNSD